ncbi:tetratricopeptide repeat protein [Pseudomonas hormoni]
MHYPESSGRKKPHGMASLKCALMIVSLFTAASTLAKETQIIGVDGHTLTLKTKTWSRPVAESATALFTGKDKAFSLYVTDVGVDTDDGWLSPDKKTLLVSQAIYGSVVGQDGEVIPTERARCDVISMETGCVLLQRAARYCAGKWVGNSWTSDDGEVLSPTMETPSPKELLKLVSNIEPVQSRAEAIEWSLSSISPDAYMACHPPARNIQGFNDLAFYLAEGGNDALALEFYRGIETVGKRVVLMLNMADSLWRMNRKDEALRYYREYGEAMNVAGKAQMIPQRAMERSVIQGMRK